MPAKNNNTLDLFEASVRREFAFLERDFAFPTPTRVPCDGGCVIRYLSPKVRVDLCYGAPEFEVILAFARADGGENLSVGDLLAGRRDDPVPAAAAATDGGGPGDAAPLITWGLVVTHGPHKSRQNLGIYRQQLIAPNKLIMRWLAHRGGALDFRDFQQANPGQPFPVAVALGADPATILGAVTGAVAGLVAITPACGFVNPMNAIFIGIMVALFCYIAVVLIKTRLGYDDSLDAFGVHGVGGIWGTLATGLFAEKAVNAAGADGLFFGNAKLFFVQLLLVIVVPLFAAGMTWIIFKAVDALVGMRVEKRDEIVGLDLTQQSESAYTVIE